MGESMTAPAIEDFFAGGVTAAKFEDKAFGTVIGGEIISDPRMQQQRDYTTGDPITYPDGNPAMQMVITVQAYPPGGQHPDGSDDDGQRAFYIKGQMRTAVGDALRKAGAKAPARGGKLWLRYERDEPVTLKNGRPGNPQKIYAAKYEPPAQAAAGQFFGDQADTPPPAATRPPATGVPGAAAVEPPPPGVVPDTWNRMNPEQRAQLREALGHLPATQPAGPAGFDDEPSF